MFLTWGRIIFPFANTKETGKSNSIIGIVPIPVLIFASKQGAFTNDPLQNQAHNFYLKWRPSGIIGTYFYRYA